MDRLTNSDGNVVLWNGAMPTYQELLNRLAAYEDTGFEPSEISEREEMFVAYRHICGGKSPEEVRAALDELSAYRALGTVEELARLKALEGQK